MLYGAPLGGLEIRRAADGSARVSGRFPYGSPAEMGRGRREVFAPRALAPGAGDVHLLASHDYARPLASKGTGTLTLRDTDTGLEFDATISADVAQTTHGRDALALLGAGLAVGVSPGFRVPVGGDEVRADGAGLLRTVRRAELFELSLVTRPAYPDAMAEARCWQPRICAPRIPRWRA